MKLKWLNYLKIDLLSTLNFYLTQLFIGQALFKSLSQFNSVKKKRQKTLQSVPYILIASRWIHNFVVETPVISKGSCPYFQAQRNKITTNTKKPVVKVFLTHGCYIFKSLTHKSLVMFPISEYGPPITIQWEQFAKHFNAKIPVSMLIRPDLWNLQHVIFFKSVKELGGVWRGFGWGCMKRKVKHF